MKQELEIIKQLMEQLEDEMSLGENDFNERLGRKKPDVEVVKIEGKMPHSMDSELEQDEEKYGMDLDHDDEMDEDPEHMSEVLGDDEDESPEEKLKSRLMKLRG